MHNRSIALSLLISLILCFGVCSCANHPSKKTVLQMIENNQAGLFQIESQQELRDTFENMLDCIVEYLDANNGYRYNKESEEFKIIKERLDHYNVRFIDSFSRFKPEYSFNTGDRGKWAELFALMQIMEEQRLTTSSN